MVKITVLCSGMIIGTHARLYYPCTRANHISRMPNGDLKLPIGALLVLYILSGARPPPDVTDVYISRILFYFITFIRFYIKFLFVLIHSGGLVINLVVYGSPLDSKDLSGALHRKYMWDSYSTRVNKVVSKIGATNQILNLLY
jgi:hypothetical protein